jgi:predicted lipoprotein with Yx(FWY)xxD motif/cytochrome c1
VSKRRLPVVVGLAAVASLLVVAGAWARLQETAAKKTVVIQTRKLTGLGTVLVDGKGRTLYMFVPDKRKRVTCKHTCAVVWPPVKLPHGAKIETKGNAKASLAGSDRDPAGGRVVTYHGWPLYTYVGDTAAGQAKGQAIDLNGGFWYVLAPSGKVIHTKVAAKTYKASAVLEARHGSGKGVITGTVKEDTSTSGTLTWKLLYTGLSGRATGVQLRRGSKVLVRLCTRGCKSGVHKTTALHGAVLETVLRSKATVSVTTKEHPSGELGGTLELEKPAAGGGSVTVPVTAALVAAGKKDAAKYSCTGCHSISGTKSTGPTWKGLAGSTVHLTGGGTTKATDSYLIGVIQDPSELQVAGYDPGVMQEAIPAGEVTNAEARAIVAYIKSLK